MCIIKLTGFRISRIHTLSFLRKFPGKVSKRRPTMNVASNGQEPQIVFSFIVRGEREMQNVQLGEEGCVNLRRQPRSMQRK